MRLVLMHKVEPNFVSFNTLNREIFLVLMKVICTAMEIFHYAYAL